MIGIIKDMSVIGKIVLVLFLLTNALSWAQESALSRLESAYKSIEDAQGSFIQISYIRDLDKTQKFRGRFFLKGDKLRWQYGGEHSQVIYLNRENLIIYDPSRKQAIQSSFSEERYGQLPLALLSRVASFEKDFEVEQKSENNLILTPKSKMANVRRIELTLHSESFPIKTMKIIDKEQNHIKIDFLSVRTNTNLKDSLFKFIPKKEDTVINY